jgi:hypothetical protein
MDNRIKVEIKIINGEWQWMGSLTPKMLKVLIKIAGLFADDSAEEVM